MNTAVVKIRQVGTSAVISIPQSILDKVNLNLGDRVVLVTQEEGEFQVISEVKILDFYIKAKGDVSHG